MSIEFAERCRGMSSAVGYVLVLGISMVGITAVLLTGAVALSDMQQSADISRAETAMSQLDAKAATVALGSSTHHQLSLGESENGQVTVEEEAGRIVIISATDSSEQTIVDERLGSVVYDVGDSTVAYQGGGVFRHEASGTRMISPPEYHYRGQTLTFPIIRVTGESWSGSAGTQLNISPNGRQALFPTATEGNPISEGHVHVRITSEFHHGWKTFFETRTEGNVHHDPANRTVSVNLTVPITETFDNAVTATADDGDAIDSSSTSPHGGFDHPQAIGVDRPSANRKIDQRITDCETNGCGDLTSELGNGVLENGTYFEDGDVTIGETSYDTSDGDIQIVVNGDLEFDGNGGPPGAAHHTISGDGSVTFFVNGDVTVSGNTGVNTGGDPSDLLLLVHSDDSQVTLNGTPQFTGYVYAPHSQLVVNGGGSPSNDNIVGGVVVEQATAHGNGNLEYAHPTGVEIEFDTMTDITYLHVTENKIKVSGE